jgi:hypothetical protein
MDRGGGGHGSCVLSMPQPPPSGPPPLQIFLALQKKGLFRWPFGRRPQGGARRDKEGQGETRRDKEGQGGTRRTRRRRLMGFQEGRRGTGICTGRTVSMGVMRANVRGEATEPRGARAHTHCVMLGTKAPLDGRPLAIRMLPSTHSIAKTAWAGARRHAKRTTRRSQGT